MTEEIVPIVSPSERKTRATSYELSIKTFLEDLQFKDVDGARDSFLIGENQVDVCGGHEDTLLIIECTMKQALGKKSLIAKIAELRGKRDVFQKGFRKSEKYGHYKNFKYILSVRNISVRREDIDYANKDECRIYIWDDNCIDYYKDLYSKIGEYAKYELLGEIGIRPASGNTVSIPAACTNIAGSDVYLFFADPRTLLEVSCVARREKGQERYYQRIINKKKLKQIASYVETGNILPNNIIIGISEQSRKYLKFTPWQTKLDYKQQLLQYGVKYGILEFPKDYRSCWIIDGQHRLYSFINTKKPIYLPVVAFHDLSMERQCKLFLDINKNQKPVPPDLVWDLNGDMIPSEPDGIISSVVKSLNEMEPLARRIHIPSKGMQTSHGYLKMSGICLSLKRTKLGTHVTYSKTENPFWNKNPDETVRQLSKALSIYFIVIKDILRKDWERGDKGLALSNGSNSILIRIFERIVSNCVLKKNAVKASDYEKYLKPLGKYLNEKTDEDYKKIRLMASSEGGKDNLLRDFVLYIRKETNDWQFGGNIDASGSSEIKSLEKRFKDLFELKFKEDRAEDVLSKDLYGKASKYLSTHGLSKRDIYRQLTFGECVRVLREKKDIFYPSFVGSNCEFHAEIDFESALGHITRHRNSQLSHDIGAAARDTDDPLFKIYIDKINKCINGILGESENDEEAEDDSDEL